MKKLVTVTVAFGIMASMATGAFADEVKPVVGEVIPTVVHGTSTTTTVATPSKGVSTLLSDGSTITVLEPFITKEDAVTLPKKLITLSKITYFYAQPNGKAMSALAPQKVTSTGNKITSAQNVQWVEIYTWLGTAWILVD